MSPTENSGQMVCIRNRTPMVIRMSGPTMDPLGLIGLSLQSVDWAAPIDLVGVRQEFRRP